MTRLSCEILTIFLSHCSDEEMDDANPIEANDSDYDPTKETKREVRDCGGPLLTKYQQIRHYCLVSH